jgi:hypothetical protein
VVAGVRHQADIHASQVLLAVADIAAAVLAADVLLVVQAHAAAAQVPLHSLTPQVAVAVVVDTVQTSAGIVTQVTLDATAVVDQPVHTIVLLTELAAVAALELQARELTELVVILVRQVAIKLDQAVEADQAAKAEFLENHGVTDKATDITAVETMAQAAADLVQVTAVDLAAKELCELFGQLLEDVIQLEIVKIKNGEF